MATGPGCHGNQTICAFLNGLVRMFVVDDVVQHHAAVRMGSSVDVFPRPERGDDDGHLVLDAHRHVMGKAVVAFVHDLVDGIGSCRPVRVRPVMGRQRLGDLNQPLLQLLGRPRIKGRHGAHHARNALGDHQLGVADDEQR